MRLRAVPEMGVCFAYTPTRPALHRLNVGSWFLASLCDGRSAASLSAAYREAMHRTGRYFDETELRDGLTRLVNLGVIRYVSERKSQKGD